MENDKREKSELEMFLEKNKDTLERFERIGKAVEEDMKEIEENKRKDPSINELDKQIEITNDFVENNPDVNVVTLEEKDRKNG